MVVPNEGQAVEQEQTAELANPWRFSVTAEEVKELTGTELVVPKGAQETDYNLMESEKLGEMCFTLDGYGYDVRVKPAAEFEGISGLYYEWDEEKTVEAGGNEAKIRFCRSQDINSVLWFDGERMYALRYYSHYNVKGDNDRIYIANYNGSDEHLMDFDVYQFDREGKTLEEYTNEEVTEYKADGYETADINGTALTVYYSEEEYEGTSYLVDRAQPDRILRGFSPFEYI